MGIDRPVEVADAKLDRSVEQLLTDIGLFFVAPFVTLAYLVLFPAIGLAILGQSWRHRKQTG